MALNKDWRDTPDTTTPLSAAAIEDLEARADAEIVAKIAAIARSSGSAAAASDALRRLGATAFDAAAGNDPRIPTQAENDALAGTSGEAGASNRYVTNSDARLPGAYQPRQVKVKRLTTQSIPNNITTAIDWDSVTYDLPLLTGANQYSSTSSTKLTCREAGLYMVVCHTSWAANSTGERYCEIALNNLSLVAVDRRTAASTAQATVSVPPIRFAVGDYLEAKVFQNSGAALDFVGTYGFGWVRVGA